MSETELIDDEEELPNKKHGNNIALWGNQATMNLNNLIYTNIMQSPYFKTELIELKTYHEVIDEIYYKVEHLEPWERGSRRTAGQTGMCGGVRGVGAGGIVSTPYCLLYKLFTLKLTRKQLRGLLDHPDSPYIRALGFMYIRYCLNPQDHWDWYKDYMDDDEELDVKAGGGCTMTIGEMIIHFLTKLDWFSTLFPRIPVPIQKKLEVHLREHRRQRAAAAALKPAAAGDEAESEEAVVEEPAPVARPPKESGGGEREYERRRDPANGDRDRRDRERERDRDRERERPRERERERDRERDRDREREREKEQGRSSERDRDRDRRERDRERERDRGRDREKERKRDNRERDRSPADRHQEVRSRSRERHRHHRRSPSPERYRDKSGGDPSRRHHRERSHDSFERDLRRERERQARRH